VALVRAVILTQDEEEHLLGLVHSFHATWSEAHNMPKELEARCRLSSGETKIAEAHGLAPEIHTECEPCIGCGTHGPSLGGDRRFGSGGFCRG
jgi:hypothetical protein